MTRGQLGLLVVLTLAVLSSAIAVVHSKYQSRQLFVDLQELREMRDQVDIEWGQLQL
ncbi:MAG: Cell division protein FtsL, partial [Pseudomonadota bacterium]